MEGIFFQGKDLGDLEKGALFKAPDSSRFKLSSD